MKRGGSRLLKLKQNGLKSWEADSQSRIDRLEKKIKLKEKTKVRRKSKEYQKRKEQKERLKLLEEENEKKNEKAGGHE